MTLRCDVFAQPESGVDTDLCEVDLVLDGVEVDSEETRLHRRAERVALHESELRVQGLVPQQVLLGRDHVLREPTTNFNVPGMGQFLLSSAFLAKGSGVCLQSRLGIGCAGPHALS